MGTEPEELSTTQADIEATRADLSRDIDELSDKISPQRMMQRQRQAARGRLTSMKDKIMGSASTRGGAASAGNRVSDSATSAVGSVTETAQGAAGSIQGRTEGNPLAAGLIAFGAGMLISALVPASEKEARAAQRMVETAKDQGVVDEATSVGKEMGQHFQESATEAAQEVKAAAQDSTQTVTREGRSSAETVKDQVKPS